MEVKGGLSQRRLKPTHIAPVALARESRRRWQALDRSARATLGTLIALVGAAVGVRVWFMVSYPTAFMGLPDSSQYAALARIDIFGDAQRPAGYPFFLRLVHHLSNSLLFTIGLQHAMGVAAGLFLYLAVRRTGAPSWLGLLPAAVVFFGGTGLFLEHSLLADSVFTFLQSVAIYLAIVALYNPAWRWPLLTGITIGVAFWMKTAAITSAIIVPVVLLTSASRTLRRRFGSAVILVIAASAMVLFYVGSQYYFTGYLGYERESAWDLYGRVTTFADCSKFTPPRGTRSLCISEPLGHRKPPPYYLYSPEAPPTKLFGPLQTASTQANAVIKKFAVAAIVHEPLGYLGAIARGLSYYIFPRAGEGESPQEMTKTLILSGPFNSARVSLAEADIAPLYPNSSSYVTGADTHALREYGKLTEIDGALLIAMLACAFIGIFFVPASMRPAVAVFTLTALSVIVFAVAALAYDARYAYPTFGPLAAGAALGAWGIGSAIARRLGRAQKSSIEPAAPSEL